MHSPFNAPQPSPALPAPPGPSSKLDSLEMVRALAAILVVLFHVEHIFGMKLGIKPFFGLFSAGYRGVDLFFVLSGFIIAYVHGPDLGQPSRLGNYLFNRAARIYPAVWIVSALAIALYAAGFGGADKADKLSPWSLFAGALLLPQTGDALVNVTWTLKFEIFFYLIFSLAIINRWAGLAVLALWQGLVLAANPPWSPAATPQELYEAFGPWGFYLRSVCLEFAVGLACAWALGSQGFRTAMARAEVQWLWLGGGLAAFVLGMALNDWPTLPGILCALGSGAIVIGLVLLEQSGRCRAPALLVTLGGASYAIYLVHYSAITLLAAVLAKAGLMVESQLLFLAAALFGIAMGLLFNRLLDQPLQRWLRRKLKPLVLGGLPLRPASPPARIDA